MPRQPTLLYRLLAWVTVIVFLGAGAIAPRVQGTHRPRAADGRTQEISPTSCQQVTLLATHTFDAKPAPVSLAWRNLDTAASSAVHRRLVACPPGFWTQRPVEAAGVAVARRTLVGVVEFRI